MKPCPLCGRSGDVLLHFDHDPGCAFEGRGAELEAHELDLTCATCRRPMLVYETLPEGIEARPSCRALGGHAHARCPTCSPPGWIACVQVFATLPDDPEDPTS